MPYRAVELKDVAMNQIFLMNSQCVKHCYAEDTTKDEETMDLANDEWWDTELCPNGKSGVAREATCGEVTVVVKIFYYY